MSINIIDFPLDSTVGHEVRMPVIEAATVLPTLDHAPGHPHLVTQRDESGRRVIVVLVTGTAPTPIGRVSPSRMVRAAMETLHPFTESGELLPPAPKAIVTFPRPWFTRQPGNKGRVGSSVSIAVSSDGESFNQGDSAYVMQPNLEPVGSSVLFAVGSDGESFNQGDTAYVVQPGATEVNPLPVMTGGDIPPRPVISIFAPQSSGRLISQPQKERNAVSQVESRTYRLAGNVSDIRRKFMRIATADGIVSVQEDAINRSLQALETDLEQKADDERAAFALIRTGRTKHTRGIVVDLSPQIGPEAA